jgi:hypothetical protein
MDLDALLDPARYTGLAARLVDRVAPADGDGESTRRATS